MSRRRSFRQALKRAVAERRLLVVPGAYDALSALLIERTGFDTMFIGGFPVAGARYGVPDIGLKGSLVPDANGQQVEGFQIHLGGTLTGGDATGSGFGRKVRGLKATAEELPDYVERVLRRYDAARNAGESFAAWTLRASDEELS